MKHKVEDLETGKIATYDNQELIDYAYALWLKVELLEGESTFTIKKPETLMDAFDYLNTYCDNLLLL